MGIGNTILKLNSDLHSLGKGALSEAFPKEFELYVCAFELINSDDKTEDYFIFPVNPSSISDKTQFLNNTKRTEGGIVTLTSPNHVPSPIMINGNFGRKFRFILNGLDRELMNGLSLQKKLLKNITNTVQQVWDSRMKTGYGCCKILEDIIKKSREKDDKGRGYTLVFHNLAFDRVQIVKPINLDFSQDQSSNMIWNYSLHMESIGDKRDYFKLNTGTGNLSSDKVLQDSMSRVLDKTTKILDKLI